MLTDKEIVDAIERNKIIIEPYHEERLGPVSYDLKTVFDRIPWDGNIARLVSEEKITLSRDIVGLVSLRSRAVVKEQIFASFSSLVDPGYSGKLTFLVYSPMDYAFNWEELFQIMFFKIGKVGTAYNERVSSTAMGRDGF